MGKIMAPKNALTILLLGWFMVLANYVITGYKISVEEEDQEWKRKLKFLNKPAVTTIQTRYGDSYNCVDFYQQPAFDHPLLKNHKSDFKMSSFDHQLKQRTNFDTQEFNPSDIWLNGEGCPISTVPIKRITKQDLIKADIAAQLAYNNSLNLNPGVEVAVLKTIEQTKYYGGGMSVSVYHPTVQNTQYSSSRIKFQNGPDSISVGWTIKKFGSSYTLSTKNSHCYNTYCPGFVILSPNVPINLLLNPYSKIGGPSYEMNLFVRKHATNGDWFLAIGKGDVPIGFWPQKIFTGLSDSANYIEWGGEVYSPPGISPPPMGAGHLPTRKLSENCYGWQVTLIGENREIDHNPPSCQPYYTGKGYELIDAGVVGPSFDRLILFGGNSI